MIMIPELTIGLAGHRQLADPGSIITGIDQAIWKIRAAFPNSKYRLLTSLAEGADRLMSWKMLVVLEAPLTAVLPMPEVEYLRDFDTPESLEEYRRLVVLAEEVIVFPMATPRSQAYLAAGRYIVEHSDLLVAIWDGQPARGDGGTGDVVTLARQCGLPLVWVHTGMRIHGIKTVTSTHLEQNLVTLERFPRKNRW
jgi:hypothetical protein